MVVAAVAVVVLVTILVAVVVTTLVVAAVVLLIVLLIQLMRRWGIRVLTERCLAAIPSWRGRDQLDPYQFCLLDPEVTKYPTLRGCGSGSV